MSLSNDRLLELLGAVGVGAFADDEDGEILGGAGSAWNRGRRCGRVAAVGLRAKGFAWFGFDASCKVSGDEFDVAGGGAAAAAGDVNAEGLDEVELCLGEFFGRKRKVGVAFVEDGEAGVGLDAEEARGLPAEDFDVLAHEFGAGGAVHAQDIDGEGFEGGNGGSHFGAQEHGAGGLHR